MGLPTQTARSEGEAVALAAANPFGLLVLDAALPPEGGVALARRLDPSGRCVTILLLPPQASTADAEAARASAHGALAKPFFPKDLEELASRLLSAPVQARPSQAVVAQSALHGSFDDSMTGRSFGGCRIERLLGRGGMGAVYLGRHEVLDTAVAIKLLPVALAQWDPEQLSRFVRGARAAARVEHPCVATVLHAGREEDFYYLIARYAEGVSLKEVLDQRGALAPAAALRVLAGAAGGLAAAHAMGVIHRDIKPSNIILSGAGDPKITDFGLARRAGDESVTSPSSIVGTPWYMSPEQCEGGAPDAPSDVYSLGATIYHCLAGQPPFQGRDAIEVLRSHVESDPPPLRERCPGAPAELARLTHEMLNRAPDARPSAAEAAARAARM